MVPVLWFRYYGSGIVVPVLWFRYCGSGIMVPVLWFLYFHGSCIFMQVDLGSCPSEVVERAVQSRELKRSIGHLNPKGLVLKVVGREEYLLEEKSISCYKVCAPSTDT